MRYETTTRFKKPIAAVPSYNTTRLTDGYLMASDLLDEILTDFIGKIELERFV